MPSPPPSKSLDKHMPKVPQWGRNLPIQQIRLWISSVFSLTSDTVALRKVSRQNSWSPAWQHSLTRHRTVWGAHTFQSRNIPTRFPHRAAQKSLTGAVGRTQVLTWNHITWFCPKQSHSFLPTLLHWDSGPSEKNDGYHCCRGEVSEWNRALQSEPQFFNLISCALVCPEH